MQFLAAHAREGRIHLGRSQPKISRHLACLRRAGVVAARREG
ncbi:MAG TPA: ArsR family transcriptional regulator [Acidobacteriaceae bacterium]|nr:ArsR family transcriptional regulator [Acidobacteriaceae bacterium]